MAAAIKPAAMSLPDAARYLGLGQSTVRTLIKNGKIRSFVHKTSKHNILGRRVVLTESMDAYIQEMLDHATH